MKILKGKYQLRPLGPGDEKGLLKLWKTAFKAEMAPSFLNWKYFDNPYSQTMMICVTENSEIVTFYGGIPFKFQYGDKEAQVVHLMDIMSHPEHRENRVFEKTARQFMAYYCTPGNVQLMYGFPGKVHYTIGERILNYQKTTFWTYFKTDVNMLKDQKNLKEKTVKMEKVEKIEDMAADFDKLWEICKPYYPFSIIRDADFVTWRFFNHPEKQYTVLKFVKPDNDEMAGYAVLSLNKKKAVIVDMLLPDSNVFFKEIAQLIGQYLISQNIDEIETWLPEYHFLANHAKTSSFTVRNEPLGAIPTVSLFDHSPSAEWIKSNFYFNMGDGDLF